MSSVPEDSCIIRKLCNRFVGRLEICNHRFEWPDQIDIWEADISPHFSLLKSQAESYIHFPHLILGHLHPPANNNPWLIVICASCWVSMSALWQGNIWAIYLTLPGPLFLLLTLNLFGCVLCVRIQCPKYVWLSSHSQAVRSVLAHKGCA